MRNLGSFGKAPDVSEPLSFEYYGVQIEVSPTFGQLDLADFMETAGAMDEDDSSALTVLKDFIRLCITEQDFDVFWSLARANRQGVGDLMTVVVAIVSDVADRPTQRSSDSSDGPSSTVANSTHVSGPAARQKAKMEAAGRPDLALMVLNAERARVAI